MREFKEYATGSALYGDDFSEDEIAKWYAEELEAYADLGAGEKQSYKYYYHALNIEHGYRWLPRREFPKVLGIGSAYGDEFLPIAEKCGAFTIIELSKKFESISIFGKPARYLKPSTSGDISLESQSQDLIVAFGALHHIPNVSHVMLEIFRVLALGGYLLLREPIVSMGNWEYPRLGLTKNERGIPLALMRSIVHQSGFRVFREGLVDFSVSSKIFAALGWETFNSRMLTKIDGALCSAFAWNANYHPLSSIQKIRPTSCFWVLEKPHKDASE